MISPFNLTDFHHHQEATFPLNGATTILAHTLMLSLQSKIYCLGNAEKVGFFSSTFSFYTVALPIPTLILSSLSSFISGCGDGEMR